MNDQVTILIIDDKRENIFALEKLLEKPGRTFLSTTSGKEGLKFALEKDVDLIILDVQMPEMDGFEVAKILKSHKRTKDIPIIFASAEKKERQSVMKGFEEGAVDYLSKPLDPELTRAKVTVLLKIQLQQRELVEKNLSLENADIQIKALNSELERNVEQLGIANKELESFSYSISHDLRAPIRSLIGYSKILEEDFMEKLDEEGKRVLQVIQQNALKMNRLVDDLLDFSKSGRKEVEKSDVDVHKLLEHLLEDIKKTLPDNVAIHLNSMTPALADPALLSQVWINLLTNAIKYSSKKDQPKIVIGCENREVETIYYINDNGTGFNMDYADKLFGVFQRLHKSSEFEGTGVGLSIVKRIVTKHGGRVWAEGKVNEGATFYFSLPRKLS